MRKRIGLGLAALLTAFCGYVVAQEMDPKAMADMMKKWEEAATPGKHHKEMAWFLGKWDVDLKFVMPGAPPQTSKATAEYEWLMKDRWMTSHLEGTLMGRPYESFLITGFDNVKKKFVTTIVSNMDTAMLRVEGTVVDPTGKIHAEYGTLDEYMTGEHDKPFKVVTRKLGDDRFVVETYDLGIGAEGVVVLEFAFTRKKG